MKKCRVLLMLALTSTLLFVGCGKQPEDNEVLSPSDVILEELPSGRRSDSQTSSEYNNVTQCTFHAVHPPHFLVS